MILAGNWKMNRGIQETRDFFKELKKKWTLNLKGNFFIFPPSISLMTAQSEVKPLPIQIGSQNTHSELKGAYTGEISGAMLKELGVQATLVGHSERREFFGETDLSATQRAQALLTQGFTVIYCMGETKLERENHQTFLVLKKQLDALTEKPLPLTGCLMIAYEPIWAIGTGLTATPQQAQEAHAFIQTTLEQKNLSKIPILYGGSVNPKNLKELLLQPAIDGTLVGGASLEPQSFWTLAQITSEIHKKT